ncbi:EAL domain-containing protein [Alicyclobacillus ferrooxydans]|uniref:EAL domain-containing protein n=1 Tax=Alicyclobacillus ferrooxydans TaxID=471514 RepID=A0A0N8PNW9_9BACL|nr:EAL domain-containing protein [Alicyclobacillus ferrooxydans]KPV42693.1 hypothetical protein AN477_16315 [Alicyclobacillus ferrooxydans]
MLTLVPYVQAIVDVNNQSVVGYEAVIRANENGILHSTSEILRKAQRRKRLPALDNAIHTTVLSQYMNPHIPIFLNCSPQTLSARKLFFPENVDLSKVILEITEGAPFHAELDDVANYLAPFRNNGLRIAIDDFGIGWANFDRLAALTPEFVKLDHSLTRDVATRQPVQDMISGLVSFAAKTHTHLIAEGIERDDQAITIQRLGVRFAQGFYYDRPKSLLPETVKEGTTNYVLS